MKTKRIFSLLLCSILICTLFTGCGANTMASGAKNYAAMDMETPAAIEEMGVVDSNASPFNNVDAGTTNALPESRKWITTVRLSAETDDLDAFGTALDEAIQGLDGYVEDQNIYNGSAYSGRRYRSASMTIRVPAKDADQFTEVMSGIANVIRNEKSLEDVTVNYSAIE